MKKKMNMEVEITPQAAVELKKVMAENREQYVRLVYQGQGCEGTQLALAVDKLQQGDSKICCGDIELIYRRKEKLYFYKSVVDYDKSLLSQGFSVKPWFTGFYNFSD